MPFGCAGELGGEGVRVRVVRGGSCEGSVIGPSLSDTAPSSPLAGVAGLCRLVPLGALVKYTTLAKVPPILESWIRSL